MKQLRYFLWLPLVVGIGFFFLMNGMPHLRWKYTFMDEGQGHDPLAARFYTSCTYLGLTSSFHLEQPDFGHCPLIRFQ